MNALPSVDFGLHRRFKCNHMKLLSKREYSLHSASFFRPVNSKAEKTCEDTSSPERRSVGVFGKCLSLLGHQAVGSHFLSAGGQSVIQRALASLETLTPISAGDMQGKKTMLDDNQDFK